MVVFFVLSANNLSKYVRENISFSVLISDDMKEADALKFQKKLNEPSNLPAISLQSVVEYPN